ncbi:polyprenyl synthetase family protein [candidate division KSB1 bacterium]|nr:polyprenyl synthetase family protein [candidate division KSB1 bacterium]
MKSEFFEQTRQYKDRVLKQIGLYLEINHTAALYEPVRYALQAGGKLLRPILAQVTCEAVGGKSQDVLDAAAALELVHVFSLVHDDIMDNDDMRRGRTTVHKKWDINAAILAGDAILIKAYEAVGRVNPIYLTRVLNNFSGAILQVCEGQALDIEFEKRDDVTLDDYFSMIDRKTARLFSLACELGAILGGGSEEQIAAMCTYGMKLGRAFQVQDDLLDVLADQETLGKDVGSDIQEDKKTFLMLYTRQHANDEQLQQLKSFAGREHLAREDMQQVIAILDRIGTIAAARQEVKNALEEARVSLALLAESNSRELLSKLLDMLEQRTF